MLLVSQLRHPPWWSVAEIAEMLCRQGDVTYWQQKETRLEDRRASVKFLLPNEKRWNSYQEARWSWCRDWLIALRKELCVAGRRMTERDVWCLYRIWQPRSRKCASEFERQVRRTCFQDPSWSVLKEVAVNQNSRESQHFDPKQVKCLLSFG